MASKAVWERNSRPHAPILWLVEPVKLGDSRLLVHGVASDAAPSLIAEYFPATAA